MLGKLFGRKKKPSVNLDPDQDEFLGAAIQEYNEKRKVTHEKYGFDKYSWFFDQETSIFQLKDEETVIYEADGQIIGTYLKSDGSWEWGWNNPNWSEEMIEDSKLVKKYGNEQGLSYFSDGMVTIGSDEYAAYFTAAGVKLSNSDSAYHGDTGDLVVYIMLKGIRESL